jgi:hypothetical protein
LRNASSVVARAAIDGLRWQTLSMPQSLRATARWTGASSVFDNIEHEDHHGFELQSL